MASTCCLKVPIKLTWRWRHWLEAASKTGQENTALRDINTFCKLLCNSSRSCFMWITLPLYLPSSMVVGSTSALLLRPQKHSLTFCTPMPMDSTRSTSFSTHGQLHQQIYQIHHEAQKQTNHIFHCSVTRKPQTAAN